MKDREETVRLDVISTFNALLQSSHLVLTDNDITNKLANELEIQTLTQQIQSRIPLVINSSKSHFNETSIKTKSALFSLLRTLSSVVPVTTSIIFQLS